jgi:hypothetical protein
LMMISKPLRFIWCVSSHQLTKPSSATGIRLRG